MDAGKKIVETFLNSAEGYFHIKRVLEDKVFRYDSKRWNYVDIRDFTSADYEKLVICTLQSLDKEFFKILPKAALHAALQYSIHTMDDYKFQGKIDAVTYDILFNILIAELNKRGC